MNNTLSLQTLFHKRIFRVPEYQRGYAWEKQQVKEFLDDLALLDSVRHHYTGTIVLLPRDKRRVDSEGNEYVETDVVDGQQRLTTIVLLLNEMSREMNSFDSELADGIKKNYVQAKDDDRQRLYKISLNNDTDDFFKDNVLPDVPNVESPPVESAKRLTKAKSQIAEYLNKAEEHKKNRETRLRKLHRKVTTQLHFNLYEVEEEAEVGIIFEVMNDRGKQLTDLEKVKNYLLYASSSLGVGDYNKRKLAKSVNTAWGKILRQLMNAGLSSPANENQLLRSHWLLQYDPQPRKWEGSKSIKRKFDLREKENHTELLGKLQDYVKTLRESCTPFCDALSPSRDGSFSQFNEQTRMRDKIILWNKKLLRIRPIATFLPLLMAVRIRWPTDLRKYLEIVKLCEKLAFRTYRIANYRPYFRQPAMFRIANEIHDGMKFDNAIHVIERQYRTSYSRGEFEKFTDAESVRKRYGWPGLKYFLYEYEHHLADNRCASPKIRWTHVRGKKNTIEHVLPQTIENQPYWKQRFDSKNHDKYKHDIGNLTLTKDNSALGNSPFDEKKGEMNSSRPCYANSLLLQERELTIWKDWTRESINERRAILLGWAKQRWHLDFNGKSDDTYAEEPGNEEDEEFNLAEA